MTEHRQHPIGTAFTAASTADDVLAGLDLSGQNAIVTGGHAGIALEVTRALARAGASVVVGARDPERAAVGVSGIDGVEVDRLDLLDPASVDGFAQRRIQSGRPLHMLVNSAVSTGGPERDGRGIERQFAVNHLGHFQLTLALLPALRAANGARVVTVSSGAQRFGFMHWDDLQFTHKYDNFAAYMQSKVANVLFSVELDRRWAAFGIRGYAAHPGVVASTALSRAAGDAALKRMGLVDEAGEPIIDALGGKKTPAQAASTIVFAAASPLLDGLGGVYLKDNDVSPLIEKDAAPAPGTIPADVAPHSIDPEAARRLWKVSEALLAPEPDTI